VPILKLLHNSLNRNRFRELCSGYEELQRRAPYMVRGAVGIFRKELIVVGNSVAFVHYEIFE